ncbi:MAG: DUF423 domain-containing protein [Gammaproteobacteria bacterium]|jgi:uncharacterized membrane protein YgdD (TMEM256/DUF423 family)
MSGQVRNLLAAGAVLGFLFVALGAFGAHGLKTVMSAEQQAWFRTGNLYLGIHAMAMLFAGILHHLFRTRTIAVAGWLFFAGVLVFSGTLFLMALGGPRWLGAVTPIGGTLFLIGWGTLVVGILKSRA